MFLGQCALESGEFRFVEEQDLDIPIVFSSTTGAAHKSEFTNWKTDAPGQFAEWQQWDAGGRQGNGPGWQVCERWRYMYDCTSPNKWRRKQGHDHGNDVEGDGKRYAGKGFLQITYKKNYQLAADKLAMSEIVSRPEVVKQYRYAALTAACYWRYTSVAEKLDEWVRKHPELSPNIDAASFSNLADVDSEESFIKSTIAVNGGLTDYNRRVGYFDRARKALGLAERYQSGLLHPGMMCTDPTLR